MNQILVGFSGGTGSMTLVWLVSMVALIYFMAIRPHKKQMNARNLMLKNLSTGDKIVTAGGLTGYISAITEEYLYVEIADGLTVEMTRQAVSQVLEEDIDDHKSIETTDSEE